MSFSGRTVEFSEPGVMGQGKVVGLMVNTARSTGKPGAYVVRLEDEGNKPAPVELVPDVPVRVEIDRPAGRLPYRLALLRETDSKGMSIERMTWQAEYRAEGILAVGACRGDAVGTRGSRSARWPSAGEPLRARARRTEHPRLCPPVRPR